MTNNAWFRRVTWTAAALLVLGLLSWRAVPPLLKGQAQLRLSETLGRNVTLGKVDFSDRFVRPNYSAALTELNGSLGAFRSDTRGCVWVAVRRSTRWPRR